MKQKKDLEILFHFYNSIRCLLYDRSAFMDYWGVLDFFRIFQAHHLNV